MQANNERETSKLKKEQGMDVKRRHIFWWIVGSFLALACLTFIVVAYRSAWVGTGFPGKTVWDWLQLLIIPLVLTLVAVLFNQATTRTERQIAQERYKEDRLIAQEHYERDQLMTLDKQREDLLQIYLDRMSELLLKEGLRTSKPDAEVRNVARVRTINLLIQLDARRVEYVFAFLSEAKLRGGSDPIVDLKRAQFTKVNWSSAHLRYVNLSGANLEEANLSMADLELADLSGARLSDANLSEASLFGANLSGANLFNVNLSGASFGDDNLALLAPKAVIHEANLTNVNLYDANLTKARLFRADLTNAILRSANLSGARLQEANFTNADFGGANLYDADLSGANLTGAILTAEQFALVRSLQGATMPDGNRHP